MGNRSSVEGMAGATGDQVRAPPSLRGTDVTASGGASDTRPATAPTASATGSSSSSSSSSGSNHSRHQHPPHQHQHERRHSASRSEASDKTAKLSYYQMAKLGYQQLVRAIIRPPRCKYSERHLGPNKFTFCGKNFTRRDFELFNMRQQVLMCSIWEPVERRADKLPCIIYMHGNSSGRVEALAQLSLALSIGCTLFAFDFSGSGLSEGEYVSLGIFEKEDLQCVVEYLRGTAKVSSIALWGRSMGAATAIMHGASDPGIAGMILDSSFADLQMLAQGMVDKGREQGYNVPAFVVKLAIRMIRSSVMKEAGFDIKDMAPINYAPRCFSPALFASGVNDNFVPPKHSVLLLEVYAGEKSLCMVEGDHNSPRTPEFFQTAASFLMNALQIPDNWILADGIQHAMTGSGPWSMIRPRFDMFDLSSYKQSRGKASNEASSSSSSSSKPSATAAATTASTATGADDADTQSRPSEIPTVPLNNNQLLFDEIIALSLVSEDDLDVGMTSERQEEIQRSLMTMLGDRTQLQATTASASSSSASSSRKSSSSSSKKHQGSKMTISSGASSDTPPAPPSDAGRIGTTGTIVMPPAPPSASAQAAGETNGWDCALCTLHNTPDVDFCEACNSERTE